MSFFFFLKKLSILILVLISQHANFFNSIETKHVFTVLGFLGGLYQLFVVSGILYSYVLGNFLTYTQLNLACGVWMVFHVLGMWYVPESPYFLVREDKKVCAEEALARIREPDHDFKTELDEIQVSEHS